MKNNLVTRYQTKAEKVIRALETLGGKANNREIAAIAGAGIPGDVSTVLHALQVQRRVKCLGDDPASQGKGRRASLWELA